MVEKEEAFLAFKRAGSDELRQQYKLARNKSKTIIKRQRFLHSQKLRRRNLFHLSFCTGIFPSAWKIANVSPIPKKGVKSDPNNYRPIAICSILAKIMESIINQKLSRYLETNRLINDRQYGFRPNRSTGDLLTLVSHKLNSTLHLSGEACVVALDISKAFDRVWHPALLSKCKSLGLGSFFTNWIGNFLSNRQIQVLVDGFTSEVHEINAGVPQGSVLAPTLFLIFINDLLALTNNPIYSYADDSSLIASYNFRKTSLATPQAKATCRSFITSSINLDLSKIDNWGKSNRVNFNAQKTQSCVISRKRDAEFFNPQINFQGVDVERFEILNILGTKFTSPLLFDEHVFSKAKDAAKCLGFLWRCKPYFSSADLLKIYKAYIRPKMENNSTIWAGACQSTLKYLDSVQKRAIRLINDESITSSLAPLGHRRNIGALSLFYRYFVGKDTCSQEIKTILPELKTFARNTRLAANDHPYFLFLPKSSTDYFENTFIIRTSKIWNILPSEVFPKAENGHVYNLQKFKCNINQIVKNINNYHLIKTYFPSPH
jgi:hypothetical protein